MFFDIRTDPLTVKMHENLLTCIIDGVSHLIAADSANMIKVIALKDFLQTKFK